MKRFTVERILGLFNQQSRPSRVDIVAEEPVEVRVGREFLYDIAHGIMPFLPSERLKHQLDEILSETQDPAVIGHHLLCACQQGDIIIQTRFSDGARAMDLTYLSARHYHFDKEKNTWIIIK